MDHIIDELIDEYHLSDYDALIVLGVIGNYANGKTNIHDIISNKLEPIIKKIISR